MLFYVASMALNAISYSLQMTCLVHVEEFIGCFPSVNLVTFRVIDVTNPAFQYPQNYYLNFLKTNYANLNDTTASLCEISFSEAFATPCFNENIPYFVSQKMVTIHQLLSLMYEISFVLNVFMTCCVH